MKSDYSIFDMLKKTVENFYHCKFNQIYECELSPLNSTENNDGLVHVQFKKFICMSYKLWCNI
jgi:hypothetical protein